MIETPENLIPADVELIGIDGNAFSVMAEVARGLRRAGNDPEVIDTYREQAMSGSYDHLLAVSLAYTEMGQ